MGVRKCGLGHGRRVPEVPQRKLAPIYAIPFLFLSLFLLLGCLANKLNTI